MPFGSSRGAFSGFSGLPQSWPPLLWSGQQCSPCKVLSNLLLPCHTPSLSLLPAFKEPCDYTGPTQMNQGYLPMNVLNRICKVPFAA